MLPVQELKEEAVPVVIIGSGVAGMECAQQLLQNGVKSILLEVFHFMKF